MGWRVVDCTNLQGSVRSERGAIVVSTNDGVEVRFPVEELAVVLFGVNTRFTSGTIHRLIGAGVTVLFCDWRGVPQGGAYEWSDHTRVGARQLAQAASTAPKKKSLWAGLIRAKINAQVTVLDWAGAPESKLLKSLARDVRSGDPGNVEGHAARVYWSALFPGEEFVREPGSGFGRNACLDYGYMIVRGFGIRAVLAAGLNPALGVFHKGRSNPFNLVDDLIEPFRPVIDAAVLELSEDATPHQPETKRALVEAATTTYDAAGLTVPTVFEKLAQSVGRYFEGEISRVAVPKWIGPSLALQSSADDG